MHDKMKRNCSLSFPRKKMLDAQRICVWEKCSVTREKQTKKMASPLDAPKPRINCSMLSQYISRAVCFVGRVEKVHPTGKTFTVSDGEGKSATIEMNEPLEEELSGIVEVIGMVSNKGVIISTTYNILREDKGIPFDLELYNEALKVIHDFSQYYPFEVAASG